MKKYLLILFLLILPFTSVASNFQVVDEFEVVDGKNIYAESKEWSVLLPNNDDAYLLKAQKNMTITDIHCIAAGGGTITINIQECSATGTSCTTTDAAITCDADGAEDDGTFTNPSIDAGDWIFIDMGVPVGTVNSLAWSIFYTEDK